MGRNGSWRIQAATALLAAFAVAAAQADGVPLATTEVRVAGAPAASAFDGAVEAVRQTTIAAQVSGAIVEIAVKAGDTVRAGQVLVRIDARAAEQTAAASEAVVRSARATLEAATKELERQRLLFEKHYTSRAALDRAEAEFKATEAQVSAQLAQAGAARAQSGYFVVKAPYAGVVADVPAMPGDMAMPGRTLLTIYDPSALRVTASVPESAMAGVRAGSGVKAEIPSLPPGHASVTPARFEVLPTTDPATHTVVVRLVLPAGLPSVRPGAFARVWLPGQSLAPTLTIPATAVVRRAEMTGVYVVDASGRPILRQVRLGRASNGDVEVLAGVDAGERIALDVQAAARVTVAKR
jgi:RND family efflux transporter MFP subunit